MAPPRSPGAARRIRSPRGPERVRRRLGAGSAPLVLLCFAGLLAACGSERISHGGGDGGGPGPLNVSGSLNEQGGHTAPASAKVVAMWTVEENLNETHHKFGEGSATASGFAMTFSGAPPAAALLSGNAGVGVLYLVPAGTTIPDGPVDDSTIRDAALGAAGDYGIVYRGAGASAPSWITAFAEGYACGIGVSAGGGVKRSYEPTGCAGVEIIVDELGAISFVDWN